MSAVLLLEEGDRVCPDCNGQGGNDVAPDYYPQVVWEDCEYCIDGRLSEDTDRREIDLTWWNAHVGHMLHNERLLAAAKRRNCDGRGVRYGATFGRGCQYQHVTKIPSGEPIALPDSESPLFRLALDISSFLAHGRPFFCR